MPVSPYRKLILYLNLEQLEASIPEMSRPAAMKGYEREGGVRTLPCLTSEECKKLRDFVDETTQFRYRTYPAAMRGQMQSTAFNPSKIDINPQL